MAEGLVSIDPVRGIVVSHVDLRELEDIYVLREVPDRFAPGSPRRAGVVV
jgi:DNA-binding GntR family transcriptional regulator